VTHGGQAGHHGGHAGHQAIPWVPLCRACGDQGFLRVDDTIDACPACARRAEMLWQAHEDFHRRETAGDTQHAAPRRAA
jgi:hypothetical protein